MQTAALIKSARKIAGLTQTELAKMAGISQPTLARLEAGHSSVSQEAVAAVLEVLRRHGVVDGATAPAGEDELPEPPQLLLERRLTAANFPIMRIPAMTEPTLADIVIAERPDGSGTWCSIAITTKGRTATQGMVRGSPGFVVWASDPSAQFRAIDGLGIVRLGPADAGRCIRWTYRGKPTIVEESAITAMLA